MRPRARLTSGKVLRAFADRFRLAEVDVRYSRAEFVEDEPGFVTGLSDGEGDQAEAIGRLVQAADVWSWV